MRPLNDSSRRAINLMALTKHSKYENHSRRGFLPCSLIERWAMKDQNMLSDNESLIRPNSISAKETRREKERKKPSKKVLSHIPSLASYFT